VTERPLHVLVVDDSAVVREAMTLVLSTAAGITVATAADPIVARRKIASQRPDVILLDLEMPRESGLDFLRSLVATDPIPVVICSSHSTAGSHAAIEALRVGAVDVVAKPRLGVRDFVQESAAHLVDALRAAAGAQVRREGPAPSGGTGPRAAAGVGPSPSPGTPSDLVVAIAASMGGPQALTEVLSALPPRVPGIVVVQHMPAAFTKGFARHLDRESAIEVKEAEHGDLIVDGRALIAPGDRHLAVVRRQGKFVVELQDGPPVMLHRPSADVLFRTAARAAGPKALGVILTGMGQDGAEAMRTLQESGATTVAQDEASCVVFGMPREAILAGGVSHVLPLAGISSFITQWAADHAFPLPLRAPHSPNSA
jgi:two-component system chemotaxis response regulator CheB